jgi:hypothetical protein
MEKIIFANHWDRIEKAIKEIDENLTELRECGLEFNGRIIVRYIGQADVSRVQFNEKMRISAEFDKASVKKVIFDPDPDPCAAGLSGNTT